MALYSVFVDWCKNNGYLKQMSMFTFKEDICALYDVDVDFETRENKRTTTQIFYKRGNFDPTMKPF